MSIFSSQFSDNWILPWHTRVEDIFFIIIICSSYIALFLAEASSKRFTYYYPWQTCYIHHLLNSLGSIHPLNFVTRFEQGATGTLSKIAVSVYSQVLIYGWVNWGPIVTTHSPHGTVLMSQLVLAELEPTMLWLGVRRANHSAIATRQMTSFSFVLSSPKYWGFSRHIHLLSCHAEAYT